MASIIILILLWASSLAEWIKLLLTTFWFFEWLLKTDKLN